MKVIIADDEPVILKGLKVLIDWEAEGLEIVASASDGVQLWELVQREHPDIVISDISMPNMTGLQFMANLNQEHYRTKVIFISGYQKFSYVQEAIRLGAVDYILKPVQKEALEKAIQKAKNHLRDEKRVDLFKTEKNELQQLFQKLNEGSEFAESELYHSFEKMGIEYKGKTFCGVCISLTEQSRKKIETEMYEKFDLIKFSAFNKIQTYLKECKKGFVIKRESDCLNLLCVVQPEEKDSLVADVIYELKARIERELGIYLQIGVGEFSENLMELGYVYKTARFAYEMKFFLQKEVICSSQIHKKFNYSFADYESVCQKIVDHLLSDGEACAQLFEKCIDLIENLHFGNRYAVINRVILFVGDMYQKLLEYHILSASDWAAEETFMEEVRCFGTMQELKQAFLHHYQRILDNMRTQVKERDYPRIAEVKQYIYDHFDEDIKMNQMAEMACVNSYYFSALFKKETGQNFKKFLTDVRMKEAKKLVVTTDYKTYEISERVGYNNVRQFTEKFKEYYGCSPSEYKNKILGS